MTDHNGMLTDHTWETPGSEWSGTPQEARSPHFPLRLQDVSQTLGLSVSPQADLKHQRESILAVTSTSLARRYSSRDDAQFVSLLPTADWQSLPDRVRDRCLHVESAAETNDVLDWISQLLTRGQTVVLLLGANDVAKHFARLAADLCRPGHALILVILETLSTVDRDPLLRLLQRLPMTTTFPADAQEARIAVRRKSAARSGMAVVVARESLETEESGDAGSAFRRQPDEPVDVAVLVYGPLSHHAEQAARILEISGKTASVVTFREISPITPRNVWKRIGPARNIVVIEPERYAGAFSEAIRQCLLPVPVQTHVVEHTATSGSETTALWLARLIQNPVCSDQQSADANSTAGKSKSSWRDTVLSTELSPDVSRWFEEYRKIGLRGRYLWQWSQVGAELTMLPSVRSDLRAHVTRTKVLSITLCVILDDIADGGGDPKWLSYLGRVVLGQENGEFPGASEKQRRTLDVVRGLADEYHHRVSQYPRAAEFADLLAYDHRQYLNSLEFSLLMSQELFSLNSTEQGVYLPHGMHMMSFGMLDMMCSPDLAIDDIGPLRSILWHLQCMGGLANQLSTWRRELNDGDFTSQIFSLALEHGHIGLDDLRRKDGGRIRTAIELGRHEAVLLQFWQDHYRWCLRKSRHIRSLDVGFLLHNHEEFLRLHLDSRGYL